jgi:putative transcription factor
MDRFQDHRTFRISTTRGVPRALWADAQTRRVQNIENETECFEIKHTSLAFGNRLKALRVHKEMSQRDLALRASVKVDIIRDYENGRAIPNPQFIRLLESILGGSLR